MRKVTVEPLAHVKELIPYIPGKPVEELERELGIENAIKMASNENPLGPSPKAVESIVKEATKVNLYPDGDCYYLKRRLSEHLGVSPDNIMVGNGSNEVIEVIARTYLGLGDEAIYSDYAFIVYPIVTKATGAKAVVSPMVDLRNDLRDIASRITPRTKIIFLANPNNPTGTIFTRDEFEWFIDRIPENVIVLVDEAYFEYVRDDNYPNTLDYHSKIKNLITVRTFSKIYGLAGLRVGYAIASKEIISYLNRVREPFNVNSLAQVAASEALCDRDHIHKSERINFEGLTYLYDQFERLGVSYLPSHANFVLVEVPSDPLEVYKRLLRYGVIVRPLEAYGLKRHLRVSVGLKEENERFIEALEKVLNEV